MNSLTFKFKMMLRISATQGKNSVNLIIKKVKSKLLQEFLSEQ